MTKLLPVSIRGECPAHYRAQECGHRAGGAIAVFSGGLREQDVPILLHATCAEVNACGEAAAYIPLEQHAMFTPGVLDQMEQLPWSAWTTWRA